MDKRSFLFVCLLTLTFFLLNHFVFDKMGSKNPAPVAVEQVTPPAPLQKDPTLPSSKELFYVLENEEQQIVFSSYGGAIAEINLPLKETPDDRSIVLPIRFDNRIAKELPQNALFPLRSYKTFSNGSVITKEPKEGGYIPFLRRDLKNSAGKVISSISPSLYALAIAPKDGTVVNYQMSKMGPDFITFTATLHGQTLTKSYRFVKDTPYTLELEVNGNGHDLWISSGVPEVELVSGSFVPVLESYNQIGKKGKIGKISLPKLDSSYVERNLTWLSNANGFFGIIISPSSGSVTGFQPKKIPGELAPTRLSLIDAEHNLYPPKDYPGYVNMIYFSPLQLNAAYRIIYLLIIDNSVIPERNSGFTYI